MTSQPLPLTPRCGHCHNTTSLLRCGRCKVQHYCSAEHQTADFSLHKTACKRVSKSHKHKEEEARKVRYEFLDENMINDPPEAIVNRFMVMSATQEYVEACFMHVECLGEIKTYDSVAVQLHHAMECLRFTFGTDKHARDLVPHLMLRLNKDQEAYDFVKWYHSTGDDVYYWNIPSSTFLNLRDSNCFEGVRDLCNEPNLNHIVAVILVKIKMISDLISLQESVESGLIPENIPPEIFNRIREHSVRSPVIKRDKEIMASRDQKHRIDRLVRQAGMLYNAVDKENKNFWPTLLNPGTNLGARPNTSRRGDIFEVQFMLQFVYDSWMETPGAMEFVHGMMKTQV